MRNYYKEALEAYSCGNFEEVQRIYNDALHERNKCRVFSDEWFCFAEQLDYVGLILLDCMEAEWKQKIVETLQTGENSERGVEND